ncbi:Fic family protein [Candidatus Woesearchaeota archaeon]|nr:Fic family protein [Candidatus Woesearchaeota archaeon]
MFIEIREVGKSKKYYLIHTYRSKGKVKRLSKYLGSNLSKIKLQKLRKKAEQQISEEIKEKDILGFELSKDEIEKYKRYERDIEIKHLQNWQKFTENFTYNTNAIEGSTVALSEVRELLRGEDKPHDNDEIETLNVAEAIEFIKNSKLKVTVAFIKKLHKICFNRTKRFAGKLRDVNVVIRDSKGMVVHEGAPVDQLKLLLEELCTWYEKHKRKYPALLLAAVMHNQFEKIHPFQDGNGRVGRLLLNYVLIRHDYPPINIRLKDRARYYRCLHEYDNKNDIKSTLKFLINQYKKQY